LQRFSLLLCHLIHCHTRMVLFQVIWTHTVNTAKFFSCFTIYFEYFVLVFHAISLLLIFTWPSGSLNSWTDNTLWIFMVNQLSCDSEHFWHMSILHDAHRLIAGSLHREHAVDAFAFSWIAIISSIFLMKSLLANSVTSWSDFSVNFEWQVGHGNFSTVFSAPRRRSTYFPKQLQEWPSRV
jgi:hypothetical protein